MVARRASTARPNALLECNALPAKGTLSQKAREREASEFAAARRQHPAGKKIART